MAALRAHKSTQESSSSRFGALPQELQIRCVEFLALGDAASLAKQLSKVTRAAARRALTRGRWRPVCEVARNGKATIEGVMGGYWKIDGNPQAGKRTWQERLAGLSDASRALFREAWALEPAEVLLIINFWTRPSPLGHWTTRAARPTDATSLFLCLVEPSIDGLGRVVAACEPSHRECARRAGHSGRPSLAEHAAERANLPCDTIWSWFWAIDAELSVDTELPSRLGDELECWEDPAQAAGFVWDTSEEYGRVWLDESMSGGEDGERIPNFIIDRARAYCSRWEDQVKAAAFIYPFMQIQLAADEFEHDVSNWD